MDIYETLLVTFTLLWITNCYAHQNIEDLINKYSVEKRYSLAKQNCIRILGSRFETDDVGGTANFKKAFKEMSLPEIDEEFSIHIIETSDEKIERLFKRELFKSYITNLYEMSEELNFNDMKIPEDWCVEQVPLVQTLIKEHHEIVEKNDEDLYINCRDFSSTKLKIVSMKEKKSFKFYLNGDYRTVNYSAYQAKPDVVFKILYYEWSRKSINFNNILGQFVKVNNITDKEKKEYEYFIKHFSLAYFQYIEDFIDKYDLINDYNKEDDQWSFISVNEFCGNSSYAISQKVQKNLIKINN